MKKINRKKDRHKDVEKNELNNKNKKIGLILTILLSLVLLLLISFLLFYKTKEKNETIKKVDNDINFSYNLKNINYPLADNTIIDEMNNYENNNYKVFINSKKQVEIYVKNKDFLYNRKYDKQVLKIKNVKSFITDGTEIMILNEDGVLYKLYLQNYYKKEDLNKYIVYKGYNSHKGQYVESDIFFKNMYLLQNFTIYKSGEDVSVFKNHKFLAKGNDEKIYSIYYTHLNAEGKELVDYMEYYDDLDTKEVVELNDFIIKTDNKKINGIITNRDKGYALDIDGKMHIYTEIGYLKNKILLPDGKEAKIQKVFIETIDSYKDNFDLYVITDNNRLYYINIPSYISLSTELKLKEVNENVSVKSISYSVPDNYKTKIDQFFITDLVITYEDNSEYIFDKIYCANTINILEGEE